MMIISGLINTFYIMVVSRIRQPATELRASYLGHADENASLRRRTAGLLPLCGRLHLHRESERGQTLGHDRARQAETQKWVMH